jgi:hypothetical protein
MNIQLVDSIINLINTLSSEERQLLNRRLSESSNWLTVRARILNRSKSIYNLQKEQKFESDIDEIIYQMREERTQQLLEACCPNEEKFE